MNLQSYFDVALKLAALAHFCILFASFQVPARLRWKEDLAQLTSFNRKLVWTYGGFTVFTIISFGILTLALRREILAGDRASMALSCFIGIYWLFRVAVDAFYFSHSEWPAGRLFAWGHALLTATFILLAATYLGVFVWHLVA